MEMDFYLGGPGCKDRSTRRGNPTAISNIVIIIILGLKTDRFLRESPPPTTHPSPVGKKAPAVTK